MFPVKPKLFPFEVLPFIVMFASGSEIIISHGCVMFPRRLIRFCTVISLNSAMAFDIVAYGEFSLPLFSVSFPSGETNRVDFKTFIPNSAGFESVNKSLCA